MPAHLKEGRACSLSEAINSFSTRDSSRPEAQTERLRRDLIAISQGEEPFIDPGAHFTQEGRALALVLINSKDFFAQLHSDLATYAHLYTIRQLSEHYRCICRFVNYLDLNQELSLIPDELQDLPLAHIHIISHGFEGDLFLLDYQDDLSGLTLSEFFRPTVILDACVTDEPVCGAPERSFAARLARANPHMTIFAPLRSVFFSEPLFKRVGDDVRVEGCVYGALDGFLDSGLSQWSAYQSGDDKRVQEHLIHGALMNRYG